MITQTEPISRRNMLKLGLFGGLAVLAGCGPCPEKTVRFPVEDLLANHNGWSVFYTDKDTKEIVEKRLFNEGGFSTKVYRDLNENQDRYTEVTFGDRGLDPVKDYQRVREYNAVIHIRTNDRIDGGFDCTGENKPSLRQYPRRHVVELEREN